MDANREQLRRAFVEAYPRYVAMVIVDRGIDMSNVIADAIVEGTSVLDALLLGLEATSFADQRQTPLELFREALRPVDRALRTEGVEPPAAGSGSAAVVAWDSYLLSPASSAALGPVAHEAHLRWGVEKAHALGADSAPTGVRTVAIVCSTGDLKAIGGQATSAGYAISDRIAEAAFVVVDVDRGAHSDALREALAASRRTIAFGTDIDDIQRAALRAQGVWKIATRSEVLERLNSLLPTLV